jgi:hypothetical protein
MMKCDDIDWPCGCGLPDGHFGRHECDECDIWWTDTERGLRGNPDVRENRNEPSWVE